MLKILEKYYFITLFTAFVLFIFPFVSSTKLFYGANNAKFFFFLLICYVVFSWFAYQLLQKKYIISFRKKYLLYSVLLLLAVGYVAGFTGFNTTLSLWSEIFRSTGYIFFTHLAVLAFIWSEVLSRKGWILLRRVVIASSALFSFLYSLGSFGFGLINQPVGFLNFTANGFQIGNETFAGIFVVISIVFTLIEISYLKKDSHRNLKVFLYVALALQFLNPLIAGFPIYKELDGLNSIIGDARSSAIVAWGILIYFLIIHKLFGANKLVARLVNGVLLASVIFASLSLFVRGSFVQNQYIALSGEARILVWESALESIADRPLLGYGPGTFNDVVQKNIDNELFLEKNGGEIWFDRAHNVLIEMLSTHGVVGLGVGFVMFVMLYVTLHRAYTKELISWREYNLWSVLFVAHVVQILTGFDTVVSYMLWGLVFGYLLWLEKNSITKNTPPSHGVTQKVFAIILIASTVLSVVFVYAHERTRQKALFTIFVTQDSEERSDLISRLENRRITLEPLRILSGGLIKGLFEDGGVSNPDLRDVSVSELARHDALLERYISQNPYDYRARMNLIHLRHAQAFLGVNKMEETNELFSGVDQISPEDNPLTFVMFGLHNLYTGNLAQAKGLIDKAVEINPDIQFTQGVQDYLDAQVIKIPRVSFLRLDNL